MTIYILDVVENQIRQTLLLSKKHEKEIYDLVKERKRPFTLCYIDFQEDRYSCLVIKKKYSNICYMYKNDAFEKSGVAFFMNDLYFDHLINF